MTNLNQTILEAIKLVLAGIIGGLIGAHGSRKVLQLPKDYPHRQIFLEPARQIQTLRFPEPAPGEKFGLASKRK
jgi:hypothetical protein